MLPLDADLETALSWRRAGLSVPDVPGVETIGRHVELQGARLRTGRGGGGCPCGAGCGGEGVKNKGRGAVEKPVCAVTLIPQSGKRVSNHGHYSRACGRRFLTALGMAVFQRPRRRRFATIGHGRTSLHASRSGVGCGKREEGMASHAGHAFR